MKKTKQKTVRNRMRANELRGFSMLFPDVIEEPIMREELQLETGEGRVMKKEDGRRS